MRNGYKVVGGCGGCLLIVLIVNLTIGGLAFDYSLNAYFGKDVPWWADMLCGLFLGEIVIPASIVAFILNLAGLTFPLFAG